MGGKNERLLCWGVEDTLLTLVEADGFFWWSNPAYPFISLRGDRIASPDACYSSTPDSVRILEISM